MKKRILIAFAGRYGSTVESGLRNFFKSNCVRHNYLSAWFYCFGRRFSEGGLFLLWDLSPVGAT